MREQLATAIAVVATPLATRYMGQLCQHFQHKLPVTLTEDNGTIDFSSGRCSLRAATERLVIRVSCADAAALPGLQDVVARHLLRFAFRDPPEVVWQAA